MKQIDPDRASITELIERGVEFHGHLGPYLVLGIKMGLLALKELKSGGYVDITANCMAGNIPPISCLVDGIQISTGCTMGKGNISSLSQGAIAMPEAKFSGHGRAISLRVRETVRREIEKIAIPDLESFSWDLANRPAEDLLERI